MERNQQIGITETAEIAFNISAFDNLRRANIIVTKSLTSKLVDKLIEHKDKCILHLTVTGYGQTVLEPVVPRPEQTAKKLGELLALGFPVSQVVLRIDPVIPTEKGIQRMTDVANIFIPFGITRIRFSVLDMYAHVKERFGKARVPLPYETFHAPLQDRLKVYETLKALAGENISVEACGEPDLPQTPCISQKDVDILGLTDSITLVGNKEQRTSCGCPANKVQIIRTKPHRCGNKCLYCFWKDDK